jgi:hypothetical protein
MTCRVWLNDGYAPIRGLAQLNILPFPVIRIASHPDNFNDHSLVAVRSFAKSLANATVLDNPISSEFAFPIASPLIKDNCRFPKVKGDYVRVNLDVTAFLYMIKSVFFCVIESKILPESFP